MELLNIDVLLIKFLDKECSTEERLYVKNWINENPENYKFYNSIRETWLITKYYDESFTPDTNAAWEKVHSKIAIKSSNSNSYKIYYSAAAILFIAVSLYLFYYLLPFKSQTNMIELANQSENLQKIDLPDGSKVWLSKNSNISYYRNFEKEERKVTLNGEAFFDVMKNPDKPFIVTGSKTMVKVLGTSFIYRTFENEPEDKLIVNSGKVAFTEKVNCKNQIEVDHGYEAKFNSATQILEKFEKDDKAYFASKTGRMIFENERFEDILSKLSKYHNRNYYIGDSTLSNTRLTIAFNSQSVQEALKLLEVVMDRKITDSAMTIVVY
jgi:transmembrane sensor